MEKALAETCPELKMWHKKSVLQLSIEEVYGKRTLLNIVFLVILITYVLAPSTIGA